MLKVRASVVNARCDTLALLELRIFLDQYMIFVSQSQVEMLVYYKL